MSDGMFAHISELSFARNAKQALGFYAVHLLITFLGFMLLAVLAKLQPALPYPEAAMLLMMFYAGVLSVKLLVAKGLTGNIKLWLVSACGVVLSYAGGFLGLLVPACLSILNPAPMVAEGDSLSKEEQP